MNIIDTAIKNWTAVNDKMRSNQYLKEILNDIDAATFIIDANANQQLYEQGVNALGVSIASYAPYKPFTIAVKKQKGQPTDRVTLRDTGDFERSFHLKIGRESFIVTADDWKTDELMEKYGKIFGLTNENKAKLCQQYIKPDLILRIKNEISNG